MNLEPKYYAIPEFTGENIPVAVASKIMKKDQQFIRQGMIQGILPIGAVFKKDGSDQYDYYISPRLFWEYTGYLYKGNLQEKSEKKF